AGARTAVFNVSLSEPRATAVTVSFATAEGSADAADFTAKSGTLTFAPGATSLNVKVAITPETVIEIHETFSLNLSGAAGVSIVDGSGLATIVNDDQ
ncbi:MAG: Calx-beta domain-containing protein, partial [Acidimicrobiales bacterium]